MFQDQRFSSPIMQTMNKTKPQQINKEYNDWFEATEFIYDKDYRYTRILKLKKIIHTRFYVYADIVHPKLQVLFKLKWT